DSSNTFFALEIDTAGSVKRRRRVVAAEPLLPDLLARLGVDAGRKATVGNLIELLAHQDRRGRVGHPATVLPGDMGVGHVALPVRADGQQGRRGVTGTDVDQPVAK